MAQLARTTWQHAWHGYMQFAFPADELRPLSCTPLHATHDPQAWDINDVAGNFSLTLVDALSAFPMLRDRRGFETAVRDVIRHVSFDQDARVQVFEVTIRALGGLLSGHMFATDPTRGYRLVWYDDQLLRLAQDLGRRLLPAFASNVSPTGIPIARVHLQQGVLPDETRETCSAGAASLLLEFAALSRLTGDDVYERVARKAFFAIWNRRSPLNLIGNGINAHSGDWTTASSSIGAGIDSTFEYMVKAFVWLDDDAFWRVWDTAHSAVMQHIRASDGFAYRAVQMVSGAPMSTYTDSLSAFWPGLLVLAGDIENAVKSHLLFSSIWERYSGSPELYNLASRSLEQGGWPLRPELIESTLFLHQATQDDRYLRFGERMLLDIVNRTRTPCGLASIDNLETGQLDDRMHSFLLSETLPYMFTLFDRTNDIHKDDSRSVFTTEGHMLLPLPTKSDATSVSTLRRSSGLLERGTCAVYAPTAYGASATHWTPLALGVDHRTDAEYGRFLAGLELDPSVAIADGRWSIYGHCDVPTVEAYSVELLFNMPGVTEDESPGRHKLEQVVSGLHIKVILGLKMAMTKVSDRSSASRLGPAYRITQVGPYRVASGATVHISDPVFMASLLPVARQDLRERGQADLELAFEGAFGTHVISSVYATTATFGTDPLAVLVHQPTIVRLSGRDDMLGCSAYNATQAGGPNAAVVVDRGGCTFSRKSLLAKQAGFALVLVADDVDQPLFTPSGAAADETVAETDLVPLVLISRAHGQTLKSAMKHLSPIRVATATPRFAEMPIIVNGLRLANARLGPPP